MVECIRADGTILPPLGIFKGKNVLESWIPPTVIDQWFFVIRMLEATDSVGNAFGLCCPRHTDTVMQALEPFDQRLHTHHG
jgi:hypothetical protein